MSFGKKKKPTGMTGGKKREAPKLWTLKEADDAFSLFIRERDGKCKRCGKKRTKENPLTCSHFWGRQHKGTRFDPENCVAVCWMPCHKYYWEKEKQGDYRDFMIGWLGNERYAVLEMRARTVYPQVNAIIDCMVLVRGAGVIPSGGSPSGDGSV